MLISRSIGNSIVRSSSRWQSNCSCVVSALLLTAACSGRALAQPNIILFLVDDMGWNDTSVEFHSSRTVWNDLYNTPSMVRLAERGIRFTNAYAASPVCSPTRASIMTGKNPGRSRVSDWVGHGISGNTYVRSPNWATTGLQPGDGNTMLPSVLRANGYRTAHVGKAHFGGAGTAGANPLNLGFDINVAGSHTGGPDGDYFLPWNSSRYPGLGDYPAGTYITDALTSEANRIIDQAAADQVPLFLNMAHYAVHAPINHQGDPEFVGKYSDRPSPEDDYAAMVESMDASLGDILDNLEEEGIADNTIVLFMSDNGGLSNHSRQMNADYTLPDGPTVHYRRDRHNWPIRSGKGSAYEGGIREPMIVAWAGQEPDEPPIQENLPIAPGGVSDEPVISDDFFPTILTLASVANAEQYTGDIDGQDLTPILDGSGVFQRDTALFFHYPHQWYQDIGVGEGIEPFTAIRDGDWKLIYFYGDGIADGQGRDPRWELYNLAEDVSEEQNLMDDHRDLAVEMADQLVTWMTDVDAQTPVSKATGQPVPLPVDIYPGVLGDLTDDGAVNVADWQLFNAALGTTISASTFFESIAQGDFDGNLAIEFFDFQTFKTIFDTHHGAGAFAAMQAAVPEPATWLLLLVGALISCLSRCGKTNW